MSLLAGAATAIAPAALSEDGRRGTVMLALVLLVVLGWIGMWWGWRRRARRQADVAELPTVPADLGPLLADEEEGVYVSSTTAGDWLDRIVARGLGVRSPALMAVSRAGVLFRRTGAPDVFVPAATVTGARLDRAAAGKAAARDELVVVTWTLGARTLDTAFRPRHADRREPLVAAVAGLTTTGSPS